MSNTANHYRVQWLVDSTLGEEDLLENFVAWWDKDVVPTKEMDPAGRFVRFSAYDIGENKWELSLCWEATQKSEDEARKFWEDWMSNTSLKESPDFFGNIGNFDRNKFEIKSVTSQEVYDSL